MNFGDFEMYESEILFLKSIKVNFNTKTNRM